MGCLPLFVKVNVSVKVDTMKALKVFVLVEEENTYGNINAFVMM